MANLNETEKNFTASQEEFGQKKLSSLPEELLIKIIEFLPYSDLSAMMIVDKKFNNLASDPTMWKRYHVPAMRIAELYGLGTVLKVLELPRFSKLEVLDLSGIRLWALKRKEKELEQKIWKIIEIASTLPLKSLNLYFIGLDQLSCPNQDFLAKMVLNIQRVQLKFTTTNFMDKHQRGGLLEKILDGVSGTSVLRSIDLGGCKLGHLPIPSIVKLSCLSEVSLEGAVMRREQVRALMMEMGKCSNIKKFDIGSRSIIDVVNYEDALLTVEPDIIAKALKGVEHSLPFSHVLRIIRGGGQV